MPNNCFVSVIVPNYCHSQYLDERIQSILNQTYQDFELIILDDCSPDDGASREVIDRYRDNPHISHIVYNEVNSGSPFKQWYKGFELAVGKYIWIAESDDKCDKRLLETLVDACQKDDAVLAFCKSQVFYDTGEKFINGSQISMERGFTMDGKLFVSEYLWIRNTIVNASAVIFRKDDAMAVKPLYTEFRAAGDWMFWIELAERGKVTFVAQVLSFFRKHPLGTTVVSNKTGLSLKENYLIFNYLSKKGYFGFYKRLKFKLRIIKYSKDINNEGKKEILRLWDKYYVYRIVLMFYFPIRNLIKIAAHLFSFVHCHSINKSIIGR